MQGMGAMTGKRLANYELGAPLGEDGFGPLYQAVHLNLERPFTLRILSDRFMFAAGFEGHFERVMRVLAELEHTNLLTLDDYGIDGPYAYLVMPLVEGMTLETWLRQRPAQPMLPAQFARVAGQMLAGMDYAHQVGVTHLGLTPRHILIQPNGHLLLANFGLPYLAEQLWIAWNGSRSFGDPVYLAPEQIPGRTPSGTAADLYALGVIFYRLLTGVAPFDGPPQTILGAKLAGPPPLRARSPDLPPPLESLIMRALAPSPEDRWESVAALSAAFEAILKQGGYLSSPGGSPGSGQGSLLLSGTLAPPLAAPEGNPVGPPAPGVSHSRPVRNTHPPVVPPAAPPPQSEPAAILSWSSAGKGRVAPPPLPPPNWRQSHSLPQPRQSSALHQVISGTIKLVLLVLTLALLGAAIFYGYGRWVQIQRQQTTPPTAVPTQPAPSGTAQR